MSRMPVSVRNIYGDPEPPDFEVSHVGGEARNGIMVCPLNPGVRCKHGYSVPPRRMCYRCGYELGFASALADMEEEVDGEDI